jgi:predicted MFS family arabinose efflux permease
LNTRLAFILVVLAVTQVISWGTIGLPPVIGRQIAADLDMDIVAVFAGTSVLYMAMGLCAPWLGRFFIRFGARRVMIAGTLVAMPGFVLLAVASGPVAYFAAWLILGAAGSATLSTASYIMLNEVAGRNARNAIGIMMLATGLSSSIFWPTTAFLSQLSGWRTTCLVYAAAMVLVCLPLYVFGLPRRSQIERVPKQPSGPEKSEAPVAASTLYLLIAAGSLNAFITLGFSSVLIELLKALGLGQAEAIAFGSVLGVLQISARAVDFLGKGRWDAITTAMVAGAVLPFAMLLLMTGARQSWAIALFIMLYGLSAGALAVARATMPLVFYDGAAYATAVSRISLPLNLVSALSPPVLASVLTRLGVNALLALAIACSCAALAILMALSRRRPSRDQS